MPEQLTFDGSAEQVKPKTDFMKHIQDFGIEDHITDPYQPQQNCAKTVIREVKKRWFCQMVKHNVPKRLWDYGIVWACEIMCFTSNSSFSLEGWTPMEQITGETPDISEYLNFGFYNWVVQGQRWAWGQLYWVLAWCGTPSQQPHVLLDSD